MVGHRVVAKIKPFQSSKVISFRNCFFRNALHKWQNKEKNDHYFAVTANKPIEMLCQITHPVFFSFSLSQFSLCVRFFFSLFLYYFMHMYMNDVRFMFMSHPWFFRTFTGTDTVLEVFLIQALKCSFSEVHFSVRLQFE